MSEAGANKEPKKMGKEMQMLRPFAPLVPTFTPGRWQEVVLVAVTLIVLPPRWLPDTLAGQLDLHD